MLHRHASLGARSNVPEDAHISCVGLKRLYDADCRIIVAAQQAHAILLKIYGKKGCVLFAQSGPLSVRANHYLSISGIP